MEACVGRRSTKAEPYTVEEFVRAADALQRTASGQAQMRAA
jgi:hypothetical protein